ncbi:MAG: hypothetical protein RIQ52_1623 [Pseudomonadota bacterium]|jgi:guanylate kinase
MSNGTLFVFSAPSGAGKTSLLKALRQDDARISVSVSHTTRAMRPGEVHGRDYFFISTEEFRERIARGDFLEHARVFDNHYGTARSTVDELLAQGMDVILEIDWQGARQVRQLVSDCVSVFILPPSREALDARLRLRGQDSEDTIIRRMSDARNEMTHYSEYDYVIINDDFERALADIRHVLAARRLTLRHLDTRAVDMIEHLLQEDA